MGEEIVSSKKIIGKQVLNGLEHILSEGHSFKYYNDLLQIAKSYGYPGPASLIIIEYFFYEKSSKEVGDMLGLTSFSVRNFIKKKVEQFNYTLSLRGKGGPNHVKKKGEADADPY